MYLKKMREVVQTLCCAGMRKFNIATGCAVRSAQPSEVVQQGFGHHLAHNPCAQPHELLMRTTSFTHAHNAHNLLRTTPRTTLRTTSAHNLPCTTSPGEAHNDFLKIQYGRILGS